MPVPSPDARLVLLGRLLQVIDDLQQLDDDLGRAPKGTLPPEYVHQLRFAIDQSIDTLVNGRPRMTSGGVMTRDRVGPLHLAMREWRKHR